MYACVLCMHMHVCAIHVCVTQLNMNRYFYDVRGLNSLQILSWIASGVRMCPDIAPELTRAHDYLVLQHGYDANVLNAKITDPNDRNDSDDELTFLPYYTWAWALNFTAPPLRHGIPAAHIRLQCNGPLRPVCARACTRAHVV